MIYGEKANWTYNVIGDIEQLKKLMLTHYISTSYTLKKLQRRRQL